MCREVEPEVQSEFFIPQKEDTEPDERTGLRKSQCNCPRHSRMSSPSCGAGAVAGREVKPQIQVQPAREEVGEETLDWNYLDSPVANLPPRLAREQHFTASGGNMPLRDKIRRPPRWTASATEFKSSSAEASAGKVPREIKLHHQVNYAGHAPDRIGWRCFDPCTYRYVI